MTNEEIKQKINFNNQKIQKLFDPSTFVLNKEIQELMAENDDLRKFCKHQYRDGVCIYCGKNEEK